MEFQLIAERFWDKVDIQGWQDCWPWTASTDQNGYGQFFPASKTCVKAHRVAYGLLVEPVPSEMTVDHVADWGCTTRLCCNPLHLEVVGRGENARRGGNARKTHCPQNHPYNEANTKVYTRPDGRTFRVCRTCRGLSQ